jgi:hypothetical protein
MDSAGGKMIQAMPTNQHVAQHSISQLIAQKYPIHDALNYHISHRDKWIQRTIVFKLLIRSRRKEDELYTTHCYYTNIIAGALEHLKEDQATPRADGAIAYISRKIREQKFSARDLGNVLQQDLGTLFSADQYPCTGSLRMSAFQRCAELLLSWFAKLSGETIRQRAKRLKSIPANQPIDTGEFDQLYLQWKQKLQEYNQYSELIIPFGRNRGRKLGEVGRRELRWLQSVLIDPEEIVFTLRALDLLLYSTASKPSDVDQAKQVPHPWRQNPKAKRRTIQQRVNQRGTRATQEFTLEQMSNAQQWRLRGELLEMKHFSKEFEALRSAITALLTEKSPGYPSVQKVLMTDEERVLAQTEYEQALDWFRTPFAQKDRRKQPYTTEELLKLETSAIERLERAAHMVQEPRVQPLTFSRTMHPGTSSSFALLYDPYTYEYILATHLSGESGIQQRHLNQIHDLYYVNFPTVKFDAPVQPTNLRLFPLQCGSRYHERQFLRPIIRHQLEAPPRSQTAPKKYAPDSVHANLPEALITNARIVCKSTKKGYREYFLHLNTKIPTPSVAAPPKTILGIYEDDSFGYGYSVLNMDGTLQSHGAIPIPKAVLPKEGKRSFTANYVFETAKAITILAKKHNALVGFDPAEWKRQGTTSRSTNRHTFMRPRQKLALVLSYKVLVAGGIPLQTVGNISPVHDCSMCHYKPRNKKKRHDKKSSSIFICDKCHLQLPVLQNLSTLVAQRTIVAIGKRYLSSLQRE